MGYYTHYTFSVQEYGDDDVTAGMIVRKIISLNRKNEDLFYPLVGENTDLYDYMDDETQADMEVSTDETHWYDFESDMLKLSREFPKVTFKLHGSGEESGDIWDAYYRDGLTCTYTLPIELPPFNEKDLHKPGASPTHTF